MNQETRFAVIYRQQQPAAPTSRRNFLQIGSLGLSGLTLPRLLQALGEAAASDDRVLVTPSHDRLLEAVEFAQEQVQKS